MRSGRPGPTPSPAPRSARAARPSHRAGWESGARSRVRRATARCRIRGGGRSALGEPAIAAHVPLAGGARWARNRIGTAHDPDHQIPGTKARARRRLQYLSETFVPDDQLALAGRRLAVFALGDLPVSAADPHQEPADQKRTFCVGRLGDLLDANAPALAWHRRDRPHRAHTLTAPPTLRHPKRGTAAHPTENRRRRLHPVRRATIWW